ncbi:sodium-dependent transporter [Lachnospiraceae bacterium HCP1S3_C3]|nr:sodium-dependent transporter [Lachnospiraceae bacterium]MDD6858669.1 sodium-dependent transporter [Lachnospiraceae bacterium]
MKESKSRANFSGKLGFVLAAAGSAVGLGNIWRFPYLAAKDGGGLFLLCYVVLALTFGFALLTTEIAIGRKTGSSPLTAYGKIHSKWKGVGVLACLVPVIILPYYCTIGGWVFKYFALFATGSGSDAVKDSFFTDYIQSDVSPIVFGIIFLAATAFIVISGVDKGIERYSKILMPVLLVLIIGISIFSLTLSHKGADGVVRTGLDGFKIYVIPDFTGLTFKKLFMVIVDALGQLFFSISVAMGIMVAYGSYVKKEVNLMNSINQIEIFDTAVAFLAGLMIVPAVYVFMGKDGMSGGPGLMFVSLPKVFGSMGKIGNFIGLLFFVMVLFAALTSSVSVMEAIVSSMMDKFKISRNKGTIIVTIYALIVGTIVCMGYNHLYFEVKLPNGVTGQILDIMDYISNNCLMPLVALLTCILVGWVVKPKMIIDEVTEGGYRFGRRRLYIIMMKFIAPILLIILLLQSIGILRI